MRKEEEKQKIRGNNLTLWLHIPFQFFFKLLILCQ